MAVKAVPEGFHTITPYLVVSDADGLLDFIQKGFDKVSNVQAMRGPDGKIAHADLMIGDSHLMLGNSGPRSEATKTMLYLYVPDCDAAFKKAVAAGGVAKSQPETQFYGDRHACVTDAWGNQWWVATHVEDVSDDEMQRRMAKARGGG